MHAIPTSLLLLLVLALRTTAFPSPHLLDVWNAYGSKLGLYDPQYSNRPLPGLPTFDEKGGGSGRRTKRAESWVVVDVYQGEGFFDDFQFFDQSDPTHYLNKSLALSRGLVEVTSDNKAIMRVDNHTDLPLGQYRDSVRITSSKSYTGGLFLLDVEHAPWGCGVWPALWTVGANWPVGGEIDIYEGVNLGTHNQVTFHTEPNCTYTRGVNQTGTIIVLQGTDCDAFVNDNSGCGITDPSQTSYGEALNALGGGVFAMKWDDDGIAAWFFHRSSIPPDVSNGDPQPSGWGYPTAQLAPGGCNPWLYFSDHSIVFDITLCGDWAGSAYSSSGCPGSCETQVMKGANFVNASWVVNSLVVFRESNFAASEAHGLRATMWTFVVSLLAVAGVIMLR
ncbi:glycoside hydrolase family 16 protein [Calocera viscosa TUFC12733]|uniref:Glycoside hydrolase family 16 protein n=1 Tax=Calocera viscosa (strain TUFC12733) TaxID=1330018 RepID=A0A167JF11_CALVF|nr:glycoside hydrolase family 16 protein [Calocera viscosa TUFC12733]